MRKIQWKIIWFIFITTLYIRFIGLALDGLRGDLTNSAIAKVLLKIGTSNALVKWLQSRLITLGFPCGNSGADAVFGSFTVTAVKNYQTKNNLIVDGIVGPNTINKLLG